MGQCKYCKGEYDYIPGIGVCINCKNMVSSSGSSSYDAEKSRKEAERARAEERAMDWRTYTDRFGNKVRVSGKTGDFQVKMFFWGWMGSSYKGNIEICYPNGDLYVGGVHGSLYHGKGKITWKETGNSYEGDWVYHHKTGKGRFTWASGDYYEGDFVDGKRTGKGKYVWPNGCYYEGDFVDGNFNGYGVRLYSDGCRYEGQFKDDKRHGKGVLASPDGTAVEYYYENDKIVRNIAESSAPTPPKATAKPRTEKQATVVPEVKKTKTVTPIVEAKASFDDIEFWNKLVKVKSDQKRKEEILASHPIVVIPEGTKRIPGYLFDKSLNLKGVRFNSDIAEIGMWDFRGCKNLGPVVVIPKGVKKIYSYAFENCSSLKKVVLPNNIIVDRLAFVDSGITEVEFETEPPRGVVLSYGAFKHCDKHMTKEMKEKIKSIGSGAFK